MKKSHIHELYGLFSKLDTPEKAALFLRDILTPHELAQIAERWRLIKRLASGYSQRKASEELHISIEKVTRGAKALRKSKGGFKLFL